MIAYRRDRLLAALTLIAGAGLALALPFALRAGAEFFLPVTAALVIAIALVPLLEWFERRRVPSGLAALLCCCCWSRWPISRSPRSCCRRRSGVRLLPERIPRIQHTLSPLLDVYQSLERFIDDVVKEFSRARGGRSRVVTVETPNSMLDLIATSAPHALIQLFFAMLVIFFFLAGWTRMRKRTITQRASFDGAMTTARVIQQVGRCHLHLSRHDHLGEPDDGPHRVADPVDARYADAFDVGRHRRVLNYIPYLGPIASIQLLGLGGLMAFVDPWYALLPAVCFAASTWSKPMSSRPRWSGGGSRSIRC